MPVSIPDLFSSQVVSLSTCGTIETSDKTLHRWAVEHEKDWYVYAFQKEGGRIYCRASLDSTEKKDSIHFHVDIATKDAFAKGSTPKISKNVPEFDDLVGPFIGLPIIVDAAVDLELEAKDWPPIMALFSRFAVKKGDVSLKMTGGILSVEGAPVSLIYWKTSQGKGDKAIISLKGATVIDFSDTYFEDCLRMMHSCAAIFLKE